MPKFQTVQAVRPELTPNRRTLAELIDHRDTALAEAKTLADRIARLARGKNAVGPLEHQLARLDAAESAAMLSWTEADDGSEPPASDAAKRSELEAKLAGARAAVSAADGATRSIEFQAQKVSATIASIQPHIALAKAFVVLDGARAVIPDLIDAIDEVKRLQMKIAAGREMALVMAESLAAEVRQPFFAVLEKFDQKEVNVMPTPRDDAAERSVWLGLAAALNDDASATLEVLS